MPIIAVQELVRRRGDSAVVDGISFQVQEGQIFGLLGPNGAGKTSTIEVIEGLDKPTSGTVTVFGRDVTEANGEIKSRIGVQLQMTGLPKYLTVMETLDLFASFYPSARVGSLDDLASRLGLQDLRNRINSKLSGGERQRVALALALVNDPDILFLDEPSAGLDPHGRRELWEVIREWQAGGKTVFLTTHDMHEAESLCDEIAIMDRGKIVAQGTVEDLIAAEENDQSIWVQSDGRDISHEPALLGLPGVSRTVAQADGAMLYTTDPAATMSKLLQLRNTGEVTFASFQLRNASLEDVFLRHTGRWLEG